MESQEVTSEIPNGCTPAEPRHTLGEGLPYGIIDPDYARVFTIARTIAWQEGYALVMHGSFTRDLDLLAVPWTDAACEADHLIARIVDASGLRPNGHPPGQKPHGRKAWTLLFPAFSDPRFVDVGVMPILPATSPAKATPAETPPWLNGEPYYCAECGAGLGEFYGCEMPDCRLETKAEAEERARKASVPKGASND